jgi:hypothetical protein
MPRLRAATAVGGPDFVWPAPRNVPRSRAATPVPVCAKLDLVKLSGDDGWHYGILHGRKEIGRLCRYPDNRWRWAVRWGPAKLISLS